LQIASAQASLNKELTSTRELSRVSVGSRVSGDTNEQNLKKAINFDNKNQQDL